MKRRCVELVVSFTHLRNKGMLMLEQKPRHFIRNLFETHLKPLNSHCFPLVFGRNAS